MLGIDPGLCSGGKGPTGPLHLACLGERRAYPWVLGTGDLQKIEAKPFVPGVFWVAVCLSVGSGSQCTLLGNDCAFLFYFSTCAYFEKLLWKYSNISKNRRVCELQLSPLVLGVTTFQFFSCSCSYLFTLSSLFLKCVMFCCGLLFKKYIFFTCL